MSDYMKSLLEERNKANKAARDIVDAAIAEKRNLTAEDTEAIARLAKRTEQDAETLADAMQALERGDELTTDQASVLMEAVDRSTPKPEVEEAPASTPLSLLSKKLDLIEMKLAI